MDFSQVDVSVRQRVKAQYGEVAERHLHFEDGFTLAAIDEDEIAGFASLVWRDLTKPLDGLEECLIDIIETRPEYRRKGVASRLLETAEDLARCSGAYQLRAWSSCDKVDALSMWSALGLGLATRRDSTPRASVGPPATYTSQPVALELVWRFAQRKRGL